MDLQALRKLLALMPPGMIKEVRCNRLNSDRSQLPIPPGTIKGRSGRLKFGGEFNFIAHEQADFVEVFPLAIEREESADFKVTGRYVRRARFPSTRASSRAFSSRCRNCQQ